VPRPSRPRHFFRRTVGRLVGRRRHRQAWVTPDFASRSRPRNAHVMLTGRLGASWATHTEVGLSARTVRRMRAIHLEGANDDHACRPAAATAANESSRHAMELGMKSRVFVAAGNAAPTGDRLPMDAVIAVGVGIATLTRDGEVVYEEGVATLQARYGGAGRGTGPVLPGARLVHPSGRAARRPALPAHGQRYLEALPARIRTLVSHAASAMRGIFLARQSGISLPEASSGVRRQSRAASGCCRRRLASGYPARLKYSRNPNDTISKYSGRRIVGSR